MKELIEIITEKVKKVFVKHNIDEGLARVSVSNRPDLCDYQCNGAMPAAKQLKRPPVEIAEMLAGDLSEFDEFEEVSAVKPGFINFKLSGDFLASYVNEMGSSEKFGIGLPAEDEALTVMIDYGGPNVAKPLHVGHLRSAVIGESIKRIIRFMGHRCIGDIHLGDWGLQMGLIVAELELREPGLVYFDESYEGSYPKEPPFTISQLEEIYPTASARSKEDKAFYEKALLYTKQMQEGKPGYRALLNHILNVSVSDLKKNYERLNVSFDLWKGESDADPFIPDMVEKMKADGFAYESEGALVVDVSLPDDKKEIPPCMILKSDGAALYDTTDLATLVWRMRDYKPDRIIYVVDKRQEMHFVQVFRCARKTGIVSESTSLEFVGFGTMNGKDGKPFKTREGGIMRLSDLIDDIDGRMLEKIRENDSIDHEDTEKISETVGLAAIKYGDLSNQPVKDYVFDVDRFISFEGNTGPYILYTIVRISSILRKYSEQGGDYRDYSIQAPHSGSDKSLMLSIVKFHGAVYAAFEENAPNKVAAFAYELSNAINHFYHETRILSIEDEKQKGGYICLLALARDLLLTAVDLLGFEAPEKM